MSETQKFRVAINRSGWNTALQRDARISIRTEPLDSGRPQTLAVTFVAPQITTRGFQFSSDAEPLPCVRAKGSQKPSSRGPRAERPRTRIAPPTDIVKLDDRLFYLLQPPLETLLDGADLSMPFQPFPYQLAGISFLFPRHTAVLADEMGLGKTMQAITAMRLLLHAGELRSILLVCPKPLVTNWQREFQLWAPEIPIATIEGDQVRREWQWKLPEAPVKIANYELLLRDRNLIADGESHFDLVVLDEAQRIKNRSSHSSQVVCSISRTRSWALTGTPVENSPDDLVGIFDFLSEGYLSPGMTPRRMRESTRDHILRRTKDQVLKDLPPKLYRDATLTLSPEQADTYAGAESDGVIRLNELGQSITIQHVFELVLRLKQICNFDPQTGQSAKLNRLEADLEEVASSGKKAIIFSQWVETLKQLSERLSRFNPVEYHGRVPSKRRDGLIQKFREDPDCHVILMSYGAGSVGLNLQFCEYVFLFDRWWNPAVEDQAINRAHRIGAAGPVTVTRFVSSATIEERIDQILTQKRELFEAILADADSPASVGLSQQEIFGLFELKVPGGCLDASADAA